MWKIQESHKWMMSPSTSYEMRRELRVRESRHTAMLFDRKYYDVESGKYITDKLPTLYSSSLAEMIEAEDDCTSRYLSRPGWCTGKNQYIENNRRRFVPKDNDFDEECKRNEEKKRAKELSNKKHQEEMLRLQQIEAARLRAEYYAQKEKVLLAEIEYQKRVKETEERLRLARERELQAFPVTINPPVVSKSMTKMEWGEKMMEEARRIRSKYER